MTSASELFYTRRSRYGRSDPDPDPDPDPMLGYSIDRNLHQNNNRRHHNHHKNQKSHLHRPDSDACDPLRRSPHVRPICPRASSHHDRVFAWLNQGAGQFVPSNRENADASSTRRSSLRTGERLPGAVLLARARLLERLRGVSVSGNRRSGRASPGNHSRDNIFGDDFRLVDAGDWGTELNLNSLTGASPFAALISETETLQLLETNKKPPGLTQEGLQNLQLEIFSSSKRILSKESSVHDPCKHSSDCSICLESFMCGETLTRLPCGHRFHSSCLDPWIQKCGDCPYCRRGVLPES